MLKKVSFAGSFISRAIRNRSSPIPDQSLYPAFVSLGDMQDREGRGSRNWPGLVLLAFLLSQGASYDVAFANSKAMLELTPPTSQRAQYLRHNRHA